MFARSSDLKGQGGGRDWSEDGELAFPRTGLGQSKGPFQFPQLNPGLSVTTGLRTGSEADKQKCILCLYFIFGYKNETQSIL